MARPKPAVAGPSGPTPPGARDGPLYAALAQSDDSASRDETNPPGGAGAPATVLVVEADKDARISTCRALRQAGYLAIEAASGQEALRAIESGGVSLALLDVDLAGLSGIEVVAVLRRQVETATLPILLITGSGDEQSVIDGLTAGADDFVAKPVRVDELVARVRAHLRIRTAWSERMAGELKARNDVIAALGLLRPAATPEETAERVVAELAARTDSDFLGVLQIDQDARLVELATFNREDGVRRGGSTLPSKLAAELISHALVGPWIQEMSALDPAPTTGFARAGLAAAAGAPIYANDRVVGLLAIGVKRGSDAPTRVRQAEALAAAIDYARVLSAIAGTAIDDRRSARANATGLRRSLAAREFHPVFQRILDLETNRIVGYEALTRFDDGTLPKVRFAAAARAGLAADYELAAIRAAIAAGRTLPPGAFLSLNISPSVLISDGHRLSEIIRRVSRPLVLELTEHAVIADYPALLAALEKFRAHSIAVDDAGAGFASLRHILELKPAYVKLDVSLVRDIDTDATRQALAAGLQYFAIRSGFRLIAEGVETQAQLDALRLIGVDLAQGYLLGRPGRSG